MSPDDFVTSYLGEPWSTHPGNAKSGNCSPHCCPYCGKPAQIERTERHETQTEVISVRLHDMRYDFQLSWHMAFSSMVDERDYRTNAAIKEIAELTHNPQAVKERMRQELLKEAQEAADAAIARAVARPSSKPVVARVTSSSRKILT